jgi:osmotically-inducible protein OsmY
MRLRVRNIIALSAVTLAMGMPSAAFAQAPPTAPVSATKDSGARPGQPSDSSLTQAVKRKLDNNPTTKDANIQVRTQDRMVTLRGHVHSRTVAQKAQQLAAGVNGVRGIENYMRYPNHE